MNAFLSLLMLGFAVIFAIFGGGESLADTHPVILFIGGYWVILAAYFGIKALGDEDD